MVCRVQAPSTRILVVDDNKSVRVALSDFLRGNGYDVIEAEDGIQGFKQALEAAPDVIVLDVVMPGIDGFRLCQLVRKRGMLTPIIMLTERATKEDIVDGFTLGADDYVSKPFNPIEIMMRIQALLRRTGADWQLQSQGKIQRGGMEIDLDRHSVSVDGTDVSLSPIEFKILRLLASSPGFVYSRQDLLNAIWDTAYEGYKRNIDPHVTRLRTKIEDNPKRPRYILTVWGVGYKFSDALA
jgi:DNA-binding response OmpR family regulator